VPRGEQFNRKLTKFYNKTNDLLYRYVIRECLLYLPTYYIRTSRYTLARIRGLVVLAGVWLRTSCAEVLEAVAH